MDGPDYIPSRRPIAEALATGTALDQLGPPEGPPSSTPTEESDPRLAPLPASDAPASEDSVWMWIDSVPLPSSLPVSVHATNRVSLHSSSPPVATSTSARLTKNT